MVSCWVDEAHSLENHHEFKILDIQLEQLFLKSFQLRKAKRGESKPLFSSEIISVLAVNFAVALEKL
jgi:hypothetical protein